MNCDELRKDIAAIKFSRSAMQEKYDRMNKTGTSGADFAESRITTEKLADEILEKYLPDFSEKNPELFDWQLGKKIEGFKDMDNEEIQQVTSAECLSDGSLLITGFPKGSRQSYLYICQFNEENGIETIDEISLAGIKGSVWANHAIRASAQLTEDTVLIGGEDGILCECTKDEGHWYLGEKIDGIGYSHEILAIGAVSDEEFFVSTNRGYVYRYFKDETGKWAKREGKVDGVIKTITRLPDGNMLLCGLNTLYEFRKDQEEEWTIIFHRDSYSDTAQDEIDFTYAVELSDDKILLGKRFGPLYEFSKDSDDKWSLSEIEDKSICGEYKEKYGITPEYILKLSDNKLLAVGRDLNYERVNERVLHEITKPSSNPLETLKHNLNRIIEKGEA